MAPYQFEDADSRRGIPASYENRIFGAQTGERIQLRKVESAGDGKHFEAEMKFLPPKKDTSPRRETNRAPHCPSKHSVAQAVHQPRASSTTRNEQASKRQSVAQAPDEDYACERGSVLSQGRQSVREQAHHEDFTGERGSLRSQGRQSVREQACHEDYAGERGNVSLRSQGRQSVREKDVFEDYGSDRKSHKSQGRQSSGRQSIPEAPRATCGCGSRSRQPVPAEAVYEDEPSLRKSHRGHGRQSAPEGTLLTKPGDFLEAEEDYLVHSCSCFNLGKAAGRASCLFRAFPAADVHAERAQRRLVDQPGDVSIHDSRIVNLYTQYAPGPPMTSVNADPKPAFQPFFEELPAGRWDTAEDRLDWFRQSLQKLARKLPVASQSDRVSLAMPVGIGCEEGRDDLWPEYLASLKEFAHANPQFKVVLYEPVRH